MKPANLPTAFRAPGTTEERLNPKLPRTGLTYTWNEEQRDFCDDDLDDRPERIKRGWGHPMHYVLKKGGVVDTENILGKLSKGFFVVVTP